MNIIQHILSMEIGQTIAQVINNLSFRVVTIWILKFILFTILNLIYVVGNTLKSLMTNAADPEDKKAIADSSNASAWVYAFYTIVVKQMVGCDVFTTVVGTYISNKIGNGIGILLSPRFIARKCIKHRVSIAHKYEEELKNFNYDLWQLKCQGILKYNHHTEMSESKEDFNKKVYFEEFKIWTLDTEADKKIQELIDKYGLKHKEMTQSK